MCRNLFIIIGLISGWGRGYNCAFFNRSHQCSVEGWSDVNKLEGISRCLGQSKVFRSICLLTKGLTVFFYFILNVCLVFWARQLWNVYRVFEVLDVFTERGFRAWFKINDTLIFNFGGCLSKRKKTSVYSRFTVELLGYFCLFQSQLRSFISSQLHQIYAFCLLLFCAKTLQLVSFNSTTLFDALIKHFYIE